jgi:hypothetical protein
MGESATVRLSSRRSPMACDRSSIPSTSSGQCVRSKGRKASAPSQTASHVERVTIPYSASLRRPGTRNGRYADLAVALQLRALPELVGQRPINKLYCHRISIGVEPLGGFLVFFPRRNRLKPPFLMQGTTYPTKGGRAQLSWSREPPVSAVGKDGSGSQGPG